MCLPAGSDAPPTVKSKFLTEPKLNEALKTHHAESTFDLIAIPECLVEDKFAVSDSEHHRLSISLRSFANLTTSFGMPFNAIFSFSRNSTETGSGFRRRCLPATSLWDVKQSWDYWCLIPFRVVKLCREGGYEHDDNNWADSSSHGEFSPSKEVHLPKQSCDIEQAQFGIWVRYDAEKEKSRAVVIHRENELGVKSFRNATGRVEEVLKSGEDGDGPLFVLLVYLARALRMWGIVGWEVNREVINYVSCLFIFFLSRLFYSFVFGLFVCVRV